MGVENGVGRPFGAERAEHHAVGEGRTSEPAGAVRASCCLACGEEAGHVGFAALVDFYAADQVMGVGRYF